MPLLEDLLPLFEEEITPTPTTTAGGQRRAARPFFVQRPPVHVRSATQLSVQTDTRIRVATQGISVLEMRTRFEAGANLELATTAQIRLHANSETQLDMTVDQRITDPDEDLILSLAVLRMRRR